MLFCFVLIPRTTSPTSHVLIKYIIACNCTLAAEPGPGSVSWKVCEELGRSGAERWSESEKGSAASQALAGSSERLSGVLCYPYAVIHTVSLLCYSREHRRLPSFCSPNPTRQMQSRPLR